MSEPKNRTTTAPTPATQRAVDALSALTERANMAGVRLTYTAIVNTVLPAALTGPNDQYDVMDDITIAVHAALCDDSPEECVAWRGACVRAVEAVRDTILGDS